MNIGNIFCNVDVDCLPKGHYIALPVIVWDVVVKKAKIPSNYFPALILKFLSVRDMSIEEIHDLTNLEERLILHILNYDLKRFVLKSIDKWHLKENVSSQAVEVVKTRVTILQSMTTGQLIPHPVYPNNLKASNYDIDEKTRPIIHGGTKGKPFTISPYVIFPNPTKLPEITEKDIDAMWNDYEDNDSELAISDYDGIKSEFIEPPERILSVSKRSLEENTIDYLLVKVNVYDNGEQYDCQDLLEPTEEISMDFLTRELKTCIDNNENVAVYLGLKESTVSIEQKDIIASKYPNYPDAVLNEICRFLALKDKVDDNASVENRMDDIILSRLQTMYECLLRGKDVLPLSNAVERLIDEDKPNYRSFALGSKLLDKKLTLENNVLKLFTAQNVWKNMTNPNASLKSLILRHLMMYFDPNPETDTWFITQLVTKGMFCDTLKFLMEMAQMRNHHSHFSDKREPIPYHYADFFGKVEKQLEIFNEVY